MSDLIIGFSGTRDGMTEAQRESVTDLLKTLQPAEVHHGDCVGSDEQFHDLAIWVTSAWIIVHPPNNPRLRAHCLDAHEIRPRKPYLERNRDIVSASDLLIATPKTIKDRTGGTWSTLACAWSQNKRNVIVRPDGEYESH